PRPGPSWGGPPALCRSCRRLPRTGRGRGHPFSHAACFASSTPPAAPPNLKHLRSQGNNPHEILLPQLAGDRSKDAGPPRVLLLVDDHRGVLVEADVRAVRALHRTLGPDHHRLDHVALLDDPAGGRLLHGSYDNITNPGVAPLGAAQHPEDRKSTRLNSSHVKISYAVFCLKKKNKIKIKSTTSHTKNTRATI